jgi:hypothetical protein
MLRLPRAAMSARVAFDVVTIVSHDRYSAQMTVPCVRHASLQRSIASTSCLL